MSDDSSGYSDKNIFPPFKFSVTPPINSTDPFTDLFVPGTRLAFVTTSHARLWPRASVEHEFYANV